MQKIVDHETGTVFLVCKVTKEGFSFPVNFTKFLKAPFLQNTSGWLLLRLKCKLKLWLQVNKFTHNFHGLSGVSYKPPHMKQHSCKDGWEFKILQQMSSEYLLSTSAYQNWLFISESGNQLWELEKKYDSNFIFTFAVVKVRYSSIPTAKFFKNGNYLK